MRVTKYAPRSPFSVLERRHSLAEIVERGARGAPVQAERMRVNLPHPEREIITFTENAPRHGHRSAQQRLGFFEAP